MHLYNIAKNAQDAYEQEKKKKYNSTQFYSEIVDYCMRYAKQGYVRVNTSGFSNDYVISEAVFYMTKDFKKKLRDEYGIKIVKVGYPDSYIGDYFFDWNLGVFQR